MAVERFNYPLQILKEASGADAFLRIKNFPGNLKGRIGIALIQSMDQFLYPLSYRRRQGLESIPRNLAILEMGIVMGSLFTSLVLSPPIETLFLVSGAKFGLNIAENAIVDLADYISYKRRVEERIRTEEL